MKRFLAFSLLTLLAACSSEKVTDSGSARRDIEERYNNRVGVATKQDFVQEFGPANWCRQQPTGDESCRFYKKITTKWMGEKTDRVHRETFDEVIAEFDSNGVLKSFKANAQR